MLVTKESQNHLVKETPLWLLGTSPSPKSFKKYTPSSVLQGHGTLLSPSQNSISLQLARTRNPLHGHLLSLLCSLKSLLSSLKFLCQSVSRREKVDSGEFSITVVAFEAFLGSCPSNLEIFQNSIFEVSSVPNQSLSLFQ